MDGHILTSPVCSLMQVLQNVEAEISTGNGFFCFICSSYFSPPHSFIKVLPLASFFPLLLLPLLLLLLLPPPPWLLLETTNVLFLSRQNVLSSHVYMMVFMSKSKVHNEIFEWCCNTIYYY